MLKFGDSNNLSITFYLKAQLEPSNPINYANLQDKTSLIRTDYALYLYEPLQRSLGENEESKQMGNPSGFITPDVDDSSLTKALNVKVGGVAGLGASDATAIISLEKLRFCAGETIKVHIDMDNSNCKKAVKSYKVKLQRKISCLAGKIGVVKPLLIQEEFLEEKKIPDVCNEKARD